VTPLFFHPEALDRRFFRDARMKWMRPVALTPTQQLRLEQLARDSGRSIAQTLRFVLRDGFDFCEWELRESRAADDDVKARGVVAHRDAQRQARVIGL
jgi:hypothetical protein